MPQSKSKNLPKCRRQRRKNRDDLAFVVLDGHRVYLGTFGTPEAKAEYLRAVSEWQVGGLRIAADQITVTELTARFWEHAKDYYCNPNSDATNEIVNLRLALKPLVAMYGPTPARDVGPLKLKAVRQVMVDGGLCRTNINKQINRIRRVFKWAVAEELVTSNVLEGLRAVEGLKRGRTTARESEPIKPVPVHLLDATLEHMTPTLAAMVRLQRLTGMRPGELVILRPCDLDMSGDVWIYRPEYHKTSYRGDTREVYIGQRAQDILRPFLSRNVKAFCFSPKESEQERRDAMHAKRTTPLSCGNTPGSNRKQRPKWTASERYTTGSYSKAIAYACCRAFPAPKGTKGDDLKQWRRDHHWSPHQLRHLFATTVRREYGLEAAQVLCGHSKADVTQVYAERDKQKAIDVIEKVG